MKNFHEFRESLNKNKNLIKDVSEGFKVGDKVKFKKDLDPKTARSHRSHLQKSGKVVKDYGDGDVKVNFGGSDDRSIDAKLLVKAK
jgi:ribosomal protein L21E